MEWFAAAWFITSQKNGVSALGLQRVLGLKSYETAWAWMHKFRRAMVVPGRDVLSGTVEVDQSYVGGISRGKAGRSSDKIGVMVAAEMVTARKLGRIRVEPAPAAQLALVEFTKRVVASGSVVKTDGTRELRRIGDLGYDPIYFTQLGSTVPAHIDLPGVQHLPSQSPEREEQGLLFYRLLQQAVTTNPTPSMR